MSKENFKNLLINHGKELQEFVLLIKLLVATKIEILKNTLGCIMRN